MITDDQYAGLCMTVKGLQKQNADLLKRAEASEKALSNLLNTSAVVESDEDFTEITCVNEHYEAAYAVLRSLPNPELSRAPRRL